MIDNLLTTSFAQDLKPGVFLYLHEEKRFVYIHYIERYEDSVLAAFAHTEVGEGNVQVDIFDIDKDALVEYFEPCQIQLN